MNKTITGKIDEYGLIYFDTDISNPNNNKVALKAKSIIDTGASNSHMKMELIEYLELESSGKTNFINPKSNLVISDIYLIDFKLNELIVNNLEIRIIDSPAFPADFIIGMDILKKCDFIYQAHAKKFELTYYLD